MSKLSEYEFIHDYKSAIFRLDLSGQEKYDSFLFPDTDHLLITGFDNLYIDSALFEHFDLIFGTTPFPSHTINIEPAPLGYGGALDTLPEGFKDKIVLPLYKFTIVSTSES